MGFMKFFTDKYASGSALVGVDDPLPVNPGGPAVATLIDNLAHDSATFGAGNAESGAAMHPQKNDVFIGGNTTDVAVTITFYGASDDTFADEQILPGSITLAAGNVTPQYGYEVMTQAWPSVRAKHTPAGNPTAGASTLKHCH